MAETSQIEQLTFYQGLMVQHAHPVKLVADTIAYLWGLYFFSQHRLAPAIIILFCVGLLGTFITWNVDKRALSKTPLGTFFLVSAHPANSTLQILGYGIIAWGAWIHQTIPVLAGVTLILLGQAWGWSRFDSRFRLRRQKSDMPQRISKFAS